jgi:hypothetical protein
VLSREPLVAGPEADTEPQVVQDVEIHRPSSHGNFILITGPSTLVPQIFRHPIRNRFRELVQVVIVVAYGCLFPAGLLCSMVWMPLAVQYAWLSYQLYAVPAMHVARYAYL